MIEGRQIHKELKGSSLTSGVLCGGYCVGESCYGGRGSYGSGGEEVR